MTQTATTITVDSLPVANSIDPVQDRVLIYTASATDIQGISRNVYLGLSSQPVGINDSQTLTNKVLDNTNTLTIKAANLTIQDGSDITKQVKFVASGITTGNTRSYTLPDYNATLATLAGTETFTNKTHTSPIINGGTIDNSTVTIDTLSGHTASTTGTVYGIAITAGVVTTASTIPTAAIQANAVTYAKLATGTLRLGYGNDTGATLTTSMVTHVTVTATTHGGVVKLQWGAQVGNANSGADRGITVQVLCDGVSTGVSPTSLNYDTPYIAGTTTNISYGFIHNQTGLLAGSHTWVLQFGAGANSAVTLVNNYLEVTEVV